MQQQSRINEIREQNNYPKQIMVEITGGCKTFKKMTHAFF